MNWLKKHKLIIVVLLLVLGSLYVYKYTYKPHKLIENSIPIFKGKASLFIQKASENLNNWNSKIIVISGRVTSIDKEGITINNEIYCQFKNPKEILLIKENLLLQIKGRVIGYDNLLEEIKLNQCILK